MPHTTCPFCHSDQLLSLSSLAGTTRELPPTPLRRSDPAPSRLIPPGPKPSLPCLTLGPLCLAFGIYLVALGTNVAPLLLAIGTFVTLTGGSMLRFNRTELPRLHRQWEQTLRCPACYQILSPGTLPELSSATGTLFAAPGSSSGSLGPPVSAIR